MENLGRNVEVFLCHHTFLARCARDPSRSFSAIMFFGKVILRKNIVTTDGAGFADPQYRLI
jgi:hypothetical protein